MKKIMLFVLLDCLTLLLNACSGAGQCVSGTERQPGNLATGEQSRDATIVMFCTDKQQYNKGDKAHITLTAQNVLDKQIVVDGGQQPVMDICTWRTKQCLSQAQPAEARLTRLVLEPGQSHTIQWDWSTPEIDTKEAVNSMNQVLVEASWLGAVGGEN
jgi:hypothetical protein